MWIPDRDVIHTREVRESREYPCRILILKRIRRLGKLRISNSGRGTVAIDCTNVQRFTITRGSNSPGNINVEGQAMDIKNGKVFVRFRKDAEGTWKVRSVLCFLLSFNRSSRSHIRKITSRTSNHQVDFLLFSRPRDLFCS